MFYSPQLTESRLFQDAELAAALSTIKGRIVYKATMDGEKGEGLAWEMNKVEKMLQKKRAKMAEVARWMCIKS